MENCCTKRINYCYLICVRWITLLYVRNRNWLLNKYKCPYWRCCHIIFLKGIKCTLMNIYFDWIWRIWRCKRELSHTSCDLKFYIRWQINLVYRIVTMFLKQYPNCYQAGTRTSTRKSETRNQCRQRKLPNI